MQTNHLNYAQQLLTQHLDIWTSAETEKKSGRGRSSASTGSVYGIKKLRELILELAMRGKLVPQEAKDEPASELLKRIQAEKTKLVEEGKIKKEKLLAPISEDEKPFELPKGWEFSRFGEYLDFQGGGQPPKDVFVEQPIYGYVQLIQIRDLGENPQPVYIPIELASKFCTPEDIMVGRYGASVGKVFWGKDGSYNVALVKIIDNFTVYFKRFLFEFLRSPSGQCFFNGMSRSAQAGFNKGDIELKILPIPPITEQNRIVAKVDALMALCDQLENQHLNALEAHETLVSELLATLTQSKDAADFNANWQRIYEHFDVLFTTQPSIAALKQTLLQLAVMGKLVPQDPNDEPAGELLKRIQAEKAKLIAEGKLKKEKPLTPISEVEKSFKLPKGWEWVKLNELLTKIGAGSTPLGGKQVYVNEGIPFLRSQNVWDDGLRLDDVAFITSDTHIKMSGTHVESGDLLFNITGASIGRCSIVPESFITGNVSQHVTIIRLVSTQILRFMHLVLTSQHVQQTVMDVQVGVSREGLSIGKLGQFVISLPPIAEQHRIVAKVDVLMALCDQLSSRIQKASQQQQLIADALVTQTVA